MLRPSNTHCTGKTLALGHVPGLSENSDLLTFVKTTQTYKKVNSIKSHCLSAMFMLKKKKSIEFHSLKYQTFPLHIYKNSAAGVYHKDMCIGRGPASHFAPGRAPLLGTCTPWTLPVTTASPLKDVRQGIFHHPLVTSAFSVTNRVVTAHSLEILNQTDSPIHTEARRQVHIKRVQSGWLQSLNEN